MDQNSWEVFWPLHWQLQLLSLLKALFIPFLVLFSTIWHIFGFNQLIYLWPKSLIWMKIAWRWGCFWNFCSCVPRGSEVPDRGTTLNHLFHEYTDGYFVASLSGTPWVRDLFMEPVPQTLPILWVPIAFRKYPVQWANKSQFLFQPEQFTVSQASNLQGNQNHAHYLCKLVCMQKDII